MFGDLLSHYPGTFYAFEPLHSISRGRISGESNTGKNAVSKSIGLLKDFWNCEPSEEIDEYLSQRFNTKRNFRLVLCNVSFIQNLNF